MTVSMNVQGTRYAATVETNGHRVEMITDENVEKHIMSQKTGGDKNAIALLELGSKLESLSPWRTTSTFVLTPLSRAMHALSTTTSFSTSPSGPTRRSRGLELSR
jgi:hypothetical protein